jgi:hypothetical protein
MNTVDDITKKLANIWYNFIVNDRSSNQIVGVAMGTRSTSSDHLIGLRQ